MTDLGRIAFGVERAIRNDNLGRYITSDGTFRGANLLTLFLYAAISIFFFLHRNPALFLIRA